MINVVAIVSNSFMKLNEEVETFFDNNCEIEQFDFTDLSESDTLGNVFVACSSPSFFNDYRLVVLKNAQEMKKGDMEHFITNLEKSLETNKLVLCFASKSLAAMWKKELKALKAELISLDKEKVADVINSFELNMDGQAKKLLLDSFEDANGIDDLKTLLTILKNTFDTNQVISGEDIKNYLTESSKSFPPYLLTNLIDENKTAEAINMFYKLVNSGNMHPLQVLAVITARYRKIAMIKSSKVTSSEQVVQIFGGKMKDYPAKLLLNVARKKSSSDIAKDFYNLHLADAHSKGFEGYESTDALVNLIVKLTKS
jgi:DNA polymerase III delta subunit